MFLRLSVAIVVACGAPPAVNTAATARPTTGTVTFTTVESSTEPPGATLVELSSYAFKPADIPLAAGKVVFYLVNTSKEAHAMALRNPAVSILAVVALSADISSGPLRRVHHRELACGGLSRELSDRRARGYDGDHDGALGRDSPLREREPRAERHEGAGEDPPHPREHVRARDDVPAD
jgi:hypothetical protein